MSLDKVRFTIEFEKNFGIEIPDIYTDDTYTVQRLAEEIAQQLNIASTDTTIRDKVYSDLSACIQKVKKKIDKEILLTDKIADYVPADNRKAVLVLEDMLKLKVPMLRKYEPHSNKRQETFRKQIRWSPHYNWETISVAHFVDAVCAKNYKDLLDAGNLKSKHEIYIAIMAIIAQVTLIDYFEILPEKVFTTDLGME